MISKKHFLSFMMYSIPKNTSLAFYVCLLLCCPCSRMMANGDPIISYSSITKTGNPIPRTIADIQIMKENLYIQPSGRYTRVDVEYILWNHSGEDYANIDYGFPVDYYGGEKSYFDPDPISESIYEAGWNKRNIKQMAFWLDDQLLEVKGSSEVIRPSGMVKVEDATEAYDGDSIYDAGESRRWFYTTFSIPAGKMVSLKVSYLIYHTLRTSLYGLDTSCFSRYSTRGQTSFSYDFSPAFHWGDGAVRDFSVVVDMSAQQHDRLEFKGLTLQQEGDKWSYHCRNFALKGAKPLEMDYNVMNLPCPTFAELAKERLNSSFYQISCLTTQPKYPVENLTDLTPSTAWVAQGNGIGATIEISFPKPQYVTDLILYNGYHKTLDLWRGNSRIKTVKLEVEREDGSYDTPYDLPLIDSYQLFENVGYDQPTIIKVSSIWDQMIDYTKESIHKINKVRKIKLTVLEVIPGNHSQDLCISELFVLAL